MEQHRENNPDGYCHPQSLIDAGALIGERTRVWAFAHILSGAVIGDDCNICDHTFIEGSVRIGDRVTVKSGVYLWDGITVEDDVFIGPAAVFTNDLKPRSRQYPENFVETRLRRGCSIGANSTILAGVTIGAWAMIGAGSVVTRNVPDFAAVWGNPGRFRYWICKCTRTMEFGGSETFKCQCGETFTFDTETERVVSTRDQMDYVT